MIKVSSVWRNKKTGNIYIVVMNCTNSTNGFDGQEMIVYRRTLDQDNNMWVRSEEEFRVKFDLVAE